MVEFLQDAGTVFRNLEACRAGATGNPEPYRRYVIGVDLAKRMNWTVLVARAIPCLSNAFFQFAGILLAISISLIRARYSFSLYSPSYKLARAKKNRQRSDPRRPLGARLPRSS